MKKVKNKVTRVIKSIIFLLILAAVVMGLDSSLKLIQEDNLCPRYYRYPDDTFDVVFLGASLVMYGIYPIEMYDEYGIASYNLSTGNQSLEASYYLAKEAIEKDHPSLIVLDCSRAWQDEESMEPQYIHYITDTMPYLNKNRIKMITELSAEGADRKPLLLPLIAYHTRWQELTYQDAIPQTKQKVYGVKITGRVEVSQPFEEAETTPNIMTESSRKYIEKTIALCKENDTEILLMTMPVIGKNKFFDQSGFNMRMSAAEDVARLAEEQGVNYFNYFGKTKELGLDLQTDAYDGEHLNRWGAEQFTKVLGQELKDTYELPDRRGEGGAYAEIDEDLAEYPLNRMRDSLTRSLFLRDYAATLKSDACEEPVEDAVVLVTLNGKVDDDILTEEDAALIRGFGLTQDLHSWDGHGYVAVIDGGKVVYETTPQILREKKEAAGEEAQAELSAGAAQKTEDAETADEEAAGEEAAENAEAADEEAAENAEAEAADGEDLQAENAEAEDVQAENAEAEAAEAAAEEAAVSDTEEAESESSEESGEFPDYPDSCSDTVGKVEFTISSGRIDEETGEVRSDDSIIVNGLEYASEDRGLHFAVFEKSTGRLMDACWLNINSLALSCTHDNH